MHFFFFSLRETRDGGLLFSIAHSWLICISICTLNIKVSKIMELQARYHIMHQNFSYRKVTSRSTSWLVAHPRIFRLFMKGKIDASNINFSSFELHSWNYVKETLWLWLNIWHLCTPFAVVNVLCSTPSLCQYTPHFLYRFLDGKKNLPAPNLAFQAFERFIGTLNNNKKIQISGWHF